MHQCIYQHLPVDFPDFGGPTIASLTGTAAPGADCARNCPGLAMNLSLADGEEVK